MASYGERPEIVTGSRIEQATLQSQAEGLQDFKRPDEGHLIMAEDRPILVMDFGTRYEGDHKSKYVYQGKYDIPIDYKVIIKWEEDEIVFMTRDRKGPEYQIVYLPKSPTLDDFTMLDWNSKIMELWEQFMTIIRQSSGDKDLSLFAQGPWVVFGVTRDEVQIALRQGVGDRTKTLGILQCADKEPTLKEYMRYLNFDPATDADFIFVFNAFKEEPLPSHFFQHVREGRVYWENAEKRVTTWDHPHLEKYRRMLHIARIQKPLPHWKSTVPFRITFLLNTVIKDEVPVDTIENVFEMARIFKINIENEPYLVHVLRRALNHYYNAIKNQRKVEDVADFLSLCHRYRNIVKQFEQAEKEELAKVKRLKRCIECDERDAVLFCDDCKDFFCQMCFDKLHKKGRRSNHRRTWVEIGICAECEEHVASFHCVQCADMYCRDCYQEWHIRGGRRNHIPIVLRAFNSQTHTLPDATPAMGTNTKKILTQARSHWFCFEDDGVNLYYNIETKESRRDMPLDVINEPIKEDEGGGLGGGWAGSWGGNMFPETVDAGAFGAGKSKAETLM